MHSDDSSAVIQTVLLSLHTTLPELSQKLLGVILNDIFSEFNEAVFDNSATVHLLEVGLCISDEKTLLDGYPLPDLRSFTAHMKGAKIFSKIDLTKAFHQINP